MSERIIKLPEVDAAKEFVQTAETCEFDIDISYNHIVIDAKSILGVLSMDLSRNLKVRYRGRNRNFESLLDKYAAS